MISANRARSTTCFSISSDFLKAYNDIVGRQKQPILCGGTGLYLEAVLGGYALSPVPQNPELRQQLEGKSLEELTQMLVELKAKTGSTMHNQTDVDTAQRAIRAIEIETFNLHIPTERRPFPHIPYVIIGVHIDRERATAAHHQSAQRPTRRGYGRRGAPLLDSGIPADDLIYYGLEYKYVTEYVIGRISYDEMFARLEIAIHQFAKRQMTWFRGMERRGFKIHWLDAMLPMEQKLERIDETH